MIRLAETIPVSTDRVWAELADLGSHDEWMADARQIRFEGAQRRGVGTRMQVPTGIGPFRTTDAMTVVEWVEGSLIAVEHSGAFHGKGRFHLEAVPEGTKLTWSEELRAPWWLGGRVGVWLATPWLKKVWRSNLARLADRVLSSP